MGYLRSIEEPLLSLASGMTAHTLISNYRPIQKGRRGLSSTASDPLLLESLLDVGVLHLDVAHIVVSIGDV